MGRKNTGSFEDWKIFEGSLLTYILLKRKFCANSFPAVWSFNDRESVLELESLKTIRILIETERYLIEGDIVLPPLGYGDALLEYINRRNDPFLEIFNAKFIPLSDDGMPWGAPVIMLSTHKVCSIREKNTDESG